MHRPVVLVAFIVCYASLAFNFNDCQPIMASFEEEPEEPTGVKEETQEDSSRTKAAMMKLMKERMEMQKIQSGYLGNHITQSNGKTVNENIEEVRQISSFPVE